MVTGAAAPGLERWCAARAAVPAAYCVLMSRDDVHRMNRDVHLLSRDDVRNDWASYWCSPDGLLEAMHAYFRGHVYHRHSHETYSFGLTETGSQGFTCRGAGHVSTAGMVMAFNPDDPHDGHAATAGGFTYRMIHMRPALLTGVLADVTGRPEEAPLFAAPVLGDPALAAALRRLHTALTGPASVLERAERLTAMVGTAARHAATPRLPGPDRRTARDRAAAAERVRAFLHDSYAGQATPAGLAAAAGCSRFAAYRAFRGWFGLSPSEYERQLRLRAARRALATGTPVADVAAAAGFADQAHLTRWFRRCYGITPGAYRAACGRT
jgi:AraC-like DNA-binding protein